MAGDEIELEIVPLLSEYDDASPVEEAPVSRSWMGWILTEVYYWTSALPNAYNSMLALSGWSSKEFLQDPVGFFTGKISYGRLGLSIASGTTSLIVNADQTRHFLPLAAEAVTARIRRCHEEPIRTGATLILGPCAAISQTSIAWYASAITAFPGQLYFAGATAINYSASRIKGLDQCLDFRFQEIRTGGDIFDLALASILALFANIIFVSKSIDGLATFLGDKDAATLPGWAQVMMGLCGSLSTPLYFISALTLRKRFMEALGHNWKQALWLLFKNTLASLSALTVGRAINDEYNPFFLHSGEWYSEPIAWVEFLSVLSTNLSSDTAHYLAAESRFFRPQPEQVDPEMTASLPMRLLPS